MSSRSRITWFSRVALTARRELALSITTRRGRLLVVAFAFCVVLPNVIRIWSEPAELRAGLPVLPQAQLAKIATIYGAGTASELSQHPPALVNLCIVTLLTLPWILLIAGYDIVARETSDRTLRLVMARTSPGALVTGKFLGLWMISSALILGCHLLVSALLGVTGRAPWGVALSASAKLSLVCALAALPYSALVVLASVVTASPGRSLIVGAAAIATLVIVRATVSLDPALALWLLPSKNDAVLFEPGPASLGAVRVGVWALGCLLFGQVILRRRAL